ncbi:hypothetical protein C7H19_02945 [Aphanothece hegewaldii CCALA 016]|uniref:Translocation and assembly module TamB C-terminal domain-containing protein n=1 Tax=Aphanothece hegewaldii CCALA 016 TaxID=2107694 RepID=A0A2T1M2P4_9CHRO|nr:translocation/assembly module TamB domain-containing protein [Aphanothece hegewaldii]PSF39026.1 hypothetical protein C7H19_02945 [Aphanothece hegewaldii CCALA 016]
MTNPNTPPEPPNRPDFLLRLRQFARRPSTLIIGVTVAAFGVVGVIGLQYFVYEKLSPLLETELSKTLKREVNIGEVENFYLLGVRVGETSIPATAKNKDSLKVQNIDLGINLLPLLIGRPVAINVSLVDPNLYLEQDITGNWQPFGLELQPQQRQIPLRFAVNVNIEDGDIALKTKAFKNPLTIEVDGQGKYIKTQNQQLEYDLEARVLNSQVNAKGTTVIETGKNQVQLAIQQLDLGKLATIIPDRKDSFKLNKGQVNADLSLNLPSFQKIRETEGNGEINLREVVAKLPPLKGLISLDANFKLDGQTLVINRGQVGIGKLKTQIKGNLDWEKGYDLDLIANSFDVPQLLADLAIDFPIKLTGKADANLKVSGLVERPIITGIVNADQAVSFDRIPLKNVIVSLQTDLDNITFRGISIQPKAGGNITGSGVIGLGIIKSLSNRQSIDWKKMPININFKANLPSQKVLTPYVSLPSRTTIGQLDAVGKVGGKLGALDVNLKWKIPDNNIADKVDIWGSGEIQFVQEDLKVRNTVLKTEDGSLNLDGNSNFKTKLWQANILANQFLLDPFLPILCQKVPSTCAYVAEINTLRVEKANIKADGNLRVINAKTVNGSGTANLKINNGTLALNSQLNKGVLRTSAIASNLDVNPFVPNLTIPVSLKQSRLNFTGEIDEVLQGKIQGLNRWQGNGEFLLLINQRPVTATTRINQGIIQASATAKTGFDVSPFLPDNITIPVSLRRTQVNVTGSLSEILEPQKFNPRNWQGNGQINLLVDNRSVQSNYTLNQGILNTFVTTESGINLSSFLPNTTIPVKLGRSNINFYGSIEPLLKGSYESLKQWQGKGDVQLLVNNRSVDINANVRQGIVQAVANTSSFPLNPFLPSNITIPVSLASSQVNITSSLNSLLAGNIPNLNTLNGTANINLLVDNNLVRTNANLRNGIIESVTRSGQLSLVKFIPKLPLPVNVNQTIINVTGNAQEILTSILNKKPDFSSLNVLANSDLSVAQGKIVAVARLNNNIWTSNFNAINLNTTYLINQFSNIKKQVALPALNANLNLSGNLNALLKGDSSIPIQAEKVFVKLGESFLDAKGNLTLENLTQRPDIANLRLDINASSNLSRLPVEQILALLPVNSQFLPSELKLAGIGQFQGRLIGRNILTTLNQPGSLQLNGNISLADFKINDRLFESYLSGTVKAGIRQEIALNLRGRQDIIAAKLDPCTRTQCLAPYLPLSFEFQQIANTNQPIIAKGRREGDRLIATIQEFPLDILRISPGKNYNVLGYLGGTVNANLAVNLFTLEGEGNLFIDQPNIGNIKFNTLQANVIYRNNIAQLRDASVTLGRSVYQIAGAFNTKTQEIQGQLNIAQGHVEDLFAALSVSDIEGLLRILQVQRTEYASSAKIQTEVVGDPNATIASQVNLLSIIEEKIRQLANQREKGSVPTELNIRGRYNANFTIAGTLKNPQANLSLQGEGWEWYPQAPYPDIVKPLGLVIVDRQFIPINEVTLQASLNNGTLDIKPARLQIRDTLFVLEGSFSTRQIISRFKVDNLSLDTISAFVEIPGEISGSLNIDGSIKGNLFNPTVQGNFALTDSAIRGRTLAQNIKGFFDYTNARFTVQSEGTDSLAFYASLPFPVIPNYNDKIEVKARLGTDALQLIDILTQDQISWLGGEGEVVLNATGRLDLTKGFTLKDLVANGNILLNNAVLRSAAFPEVLTVNGLINLTPERLEVRQLSGTFAESEIIVAGILPFFEPTAAGNNPLTLLIEQGRIKLENLYEGGVDGRVTVTGTAFNPIIGGQVQLNNGEIYVPQQRNREENRSRPVANQWIQTTNRQANRFPARFKNLQVSFVNLMVEQDLLYQFNFGGGLTLNGPVNDLKNLRANGEILLDRGRFNFFDTRFLLNRRHPNRIVFTPTQGLLNPELDIQMRTILTEFAEARSGFAKLRRNENSNEIPDNSLNRVQRIDVTLSLNGRLSQLFPDFGRDINQVCQIRSANPPIPEQINYSEEKLQKLVTCIQVLAFSSGQNTQLLGNPLVRLTSSPPRSEGEIVRLLGDQLLGLVESLQGKNTEQLIETGVVQLVIPLLLQGYVYDIENAVSNRIKATDFNILPYLQAVYRVGDESFVRFSYDYNFNEFSVRYETRF